MTFAIFYPAIVCSAKVNINSVFACDLFDYVKRTALFCIEGEPNEAPKNSRYHPQQL